jgi:DNA (cytosine-5)-methyltransferase 1
MKRISKPSGKGKGAGAYFIHMAGEQVVKNSHGRFIDGRRLLESDSARNMANKKRSLVIPPNPADPKSGRDEPDISEPAIPDLRRSRDVSNVTRMSHHGESGRIVIDVEPELKRELYSTLSLSGKTLKDWFLKAAKSYVQDSSQPTLFQAKAPIPPLNGKRKITKPLKVISMFSGCGGMDLGFTGGFEFLGRTYESLPIKIVWANDINPSACKTYKHNIGAEITLGDVWKLMDSMPKDADVIIGGFPCQDISVNGHGNGVINGARSGLYRAIVEAIKRIQPKVFVAENVASLLNENQEESYRQVLRDFLDLGYNVHHQVYVAADFGVPQTRERVLFVGTMTNASVKSFVPPQEERDEDTWITAQQAIGDLEDKDESKELNHIWSRANVSPEQGNRKLKANRPGYTIRAECHGNIQWHYRLQRRISMREAARIQSFPDKFVFQAGLRETERMVGNAVPPVLAWHIARAVLACFG